MSGVVTGPDGAPVAGAKITPLLPVQWEDPAQGSVIQDLGPLFDIVTDSDGRFLVEDMPAGKAFAIRAWHPEVGRTDLGMHTRSAGAGPFFILPGGDPIPLALPGGGSLTGLVRTFDNSPLPENTAVRLKRLGIPDTPPQILPVDGATARYEAGPLAPGGYVVEALAPPLVARPVQITIETGAHVSAPAVVLGPGAILSGAVVHAETGEVLPDADLQLVVNFQGEGAVTLDGQVEKGSFRVSLRPGNLSLFLIGLNGDVVPEDRKRELVLEHGQSYGDLRIRVVPYPTITGTVLLPDGEPAAGAEVLYYGDVRATADAAGRFSLRVPVQSPNAEPVILGAVYCGNPILLGSASLAPGLGTGADVTITVATPAEVLGTVTDVNKIPIPNFPVDLTQGPLPSQRVYTDTEGRFHLRGIFPGRDSVASPYLGRHTDLPPLLPGELYDLKRLYADPGLRASLPIPLTTMRCGQIISESFP